MCVTVPGFCSWVTSIRPINPQTRWPSVGEVISYSLWVRGSNQLIFQRRVCDRVWGTQIRYWAGGVEPPPGAGEQGRPQSMQHPCGLSRGQRWGSLGPRRELRGSESTAAWGAAWIWHGESALSAARRSACWPASRCRGSKSGAAEARCPRAAVADRGGVGNAAL